MRCKLNNPALYTRRVRNYYLIISITFSIIDCYYIDTNSFVLKLIRMATKNPTPATTAQKNNFINRFEEIIKDNDRLKDNCKIQFFDTLAKSNYVINGLNGRSINVLEHLTLDEKEEYKVLKSNWQD